MIDFKEKSLLKMKYEIVTKSFFKNFNSAENYNKSKCVWLINIPYYITHKGKPERIMGRSS